MLLQLPLQLQLRHWGRCREGWRRVRTGVRVRGGQSPLRRPPRRRIREPAASPPRPGGRRLPGSSASTQPISKPSGGSTRRTGSTELEGRSRHSRYGRRSRGPSGRDGRASKRRSSRRSGRTRRVSSGETVRSRTREPGSIRGDSRGMRRRRHPPGASAPRPRTPW